MLHDRPPPPTPSGVTWGAREIACLRGNRGLLRITQEIVSPMGTAIVESVNEMELTMIPVLEQGLRSRTLQYQFCHQLKLSILGMPRDETTLQPLVYLNKLPDILPKGCHILLVDPMLAIVGMVYAAVDLLKERGAEITHRIISAVAAPPALKKLNQRFRGICVYPGAMDQIVNEKGFRVPGLGDVGDRSYGT